MEVVATVEPLAQAGRLTLRTDLCPEVIADGNRNHLRRLLNNLLDNALKFTPPGGVIEIALESGDAIAKLLIADNGPGIAEADLPFIFDRFFRGKGRRETGSGLGLSLCREIAQLHGGALTARNRADGGAEFVVVLPLARHNLNVC
jgi:signal transduction histidine kinase